jgi:hypothetical protein
MSMTKEEAFAYHGIELRNRQNAWSGHSVQHNTVAFSVYPIYFDFRNGPLYRFHREHAARPNLSAAQRTHGLKWLIEDHAYAVAHTNRIVHGVWLEPKNYGAEVWESDPEFTAPCKDLVLELIGGIDEQTGYYEAKVLWLPVPIRPILDSSILRRESA